VEIDGVIKSRIENFGYGLPKFSQYLHTWGEVGTIKTGKVGKTGNQGATCMLIGYANNHEGNCYDMWNPVTNQVSKTHDLIFLQRMFYEGRNNKEAMREPTVALQVPHRNKNGNEDSNNEYVIQDKRVCNPNDPSGLETREGTRVTVHSDSNSKRPTEGSATKDTTWVEHITRSGQATGIKSGLYDPSKGGNKTVPGNTSLAMLNYYACIQEIEEEEIKCNIEVAGAYDEFSNVGSGLGGGFENTNELKPMKYNEAIHGPDRKE
jgi:hypothetical protein